MGRILVIDDEPDVLNIIVEILKTAGYDVVSAPNGEAGIKELDNNFFDLVFTTVVDGFVYSPGRCDFRTKGYRIPSDDIAS